MIHHCWLFDRKDIWHIKFLAPAIPIGSSLRLLWGPSRTWSDLRKEFAGYKTYSRKVVVASFYTLFIFLVTFKWGISLHCALASCGTVYCNWYCLWVCLFVCESVTTITRIAYIDPHQTGFVGKGSDHLQLIKFWPSCTPGRGSAAGRNFLAPPYYSQRAVFASLSTFSFLLLLII